jgi:predicted metal-binding membrane protein
MSEDVLPQPLTQLSPAASRLGHICARPKTVAVLCIVALTGLGWAYLALAIFGGAGASTTFLDALCRPSFGTDAIGGLNALLIVLMWAAMTLAMMLPSAAPMIFTYAEIADTAARKGERIVSPFVLTAGYAAVWLGFALLASALQLALTRLALIDVTMRSVSTLFSGAIFIGAGFYQFSALKQACLRQCQRPFPFFFANWSTERRGVFRLGLRQGLYCVGCCWAAMLVMFAVGVMNVLWMAAIGVVMTIEKMTTTMRFSRIVGATLIAIGAAMMIVSAFAHMSR